MAKRRTTKRSIRPTPPWMLSFTDLTQQLLIFFILLFAMSEVSRGELQQILSSFKGAFGMLTGGMTLAKGMLAELGQNVQSLPSKERGERLSKEKEQALSVFQPELKSRRVKITEDERGGRHLAPRGRFLRIRQPRPHPGGGGGREKDGRHAERPGLLEKHHQGRRAHGQQGHPGREPPQEVLPHELGALRREGRLGRAAAQRGVRDQR